MKHGIALLPPEPATYAAWCRLAEEAGFDAIWVPDSQSLYRELYLSCAVCAMHTRRVTLGPCVSNPLTRHPAVAASAAATLDELSGGRAVFGIATGDSAVWNLGLRPARVEELGAYLAAVRALLEEGAADWGGGRCVLPWRKKRVPLYLAAEGPRTLRLAGEAADGVFIGAGLTPEVAADCLGFLEEGARRAGRRLEDIDVWWLVKVSVNADGARAREEVRTALAASAHHAFRAGLEGRRVPGELEGALAELGRRYAPHEHEMPDRRANADLVDELGLRDYLLERFAVAGTPAECRARLAALERVGVRNLRLSAHVPDRPAFMRLWSAEVMGRGVG